MLAENGGTGGGLTGKSYCRPEMEEVALVKWLVC